jgi:hypothetical protein
MSFPPKLARMTDLACELDLSPMTVSRFISEAQKHKIEVNRLARAHDSRLIRPGARRMLCAPSSNRPECLGAVNENGTRTLIDRNPRTESFEFPLRTKEREWAAQAQSNGSVALKQEQ